MPQGALAQVQVGARAQQIGLIGLMPLPAVLYVVEVDQQTVVLSLEKDGPPILDLEKKGPWHIERDKFLFQP